MVENTPFTKVKQDGKWFALLGKYRLDKKVYETEEELEEDVQKITWNRIASVICAYVELATKQENE